MQINYYIPSETSFVFYNWTLASRHYQAAQATSDKVDELVRQKIIYSKTETSHSWVFHTLWCLLEVLPIVGLFFAILDRALFNYDLRPLPPSSEIPAPKTPPPSPAPFSALLDKLSKLEEDGFFKNKGQEVAKKAFKEAMAEQGLEVSYITAEGWDHSLPEQPLDPNIFHWSVTDGVENDIPKAGKDQKRVHLFSAASQYNAAEAPSAYTPPLGQAMLKSKNDNTQGPLAQRTNPLVFELVTAYLTHLGFNMMEKALPSAGTTFAHGSPIEHGYLRPTNENIKHLADELEANFEKYEAPCYESRLKGASESVYLILGAAPAIAYSYDLNPETDACKRLQYWAYVANFTAQFKQTLALLEKYPDKEVVLHITGVGLGVFGCDGRSFAEALKHTGSLFQKQLSEKDRKRVFVQLESHHGTDALQEVCVKHLKLDSGARIE